LIPSSKGKGRTKRNRSPRATKAPVLASLAVRAYGTPLCARRTNGALGA
jgi:hypothetical protein